MNDKSDDDNHSPQNKTGHDRTLPKVIDANDLEEECPYRAETGTTESADGKIDDGETTTQGTHRSYRGNSLAAILITATSLLCVFLLVNVHYQIKHIDKRLFTLERIDNKINFLEKNSKKIVAQERLDTASLVSRIDTLISNAISSMRVKGDIIPGEEKRAQRLAKAQEDARETIQALGKKLDIATQKLAKRQDRTQSASQYALQSASLTVAIIDLERAMQRGQPFTAELDTVSSLVADAPGIDRLRLHAKNGVPTYGELARSFTAIASSIIAADSSGGSGFLNRMSDGIRSIIRIRRTGHVDGQTTADIVARAEDHLQNNDLASALAEIKLLAGAPLDVAKQWIEKAETRMKIEYLIVNLARMPIKKYE